MKALLDEDSLVRKYARPILMGGLVLIVFVALWVGAYSPIGRPPDSVSVVTIDPVYRPVAVKILRDEGAYRNRAIPIRPQEVALVCDSSIHAMLIDVTDVPLEQELLWRKQAAQPDSTEFQQFEWRDRVVHHSGPTKQVRWTVRGWDWKTCTYLLVVHSHDRPSAEVQLRVSYGGVGERQR